MGALQFLYLDDKIKAGERGRGLLQFLRFPTRTTKPQQGNGNGEDGFTILYLDDKTKAGGLLQFLYFSTWTTKWKQGKGKRGEGFAISLFLCLDSKVKAREGETGRGLCDFSISLLGQRNESKGTGSGLCSFSTWATKSNRGRGLLQFLHFPTRITKSQQGNGNGEEGFAIFLFGRQNQTRGRGLCNFSTWTTKPNQEKGGARLWQHTELSHRGTEESSGRQHQVEIHPNTTLPESLECGRSPGVQVHLHSHAAQLGPELAQGRAASPDVAYSSANIAAHIFCVT